MTLYELQKVLGERIEIANDMAMSEEERKKENETSDIIARLAKQMINNADVVLRTDKLIAEGKLRESTIEKIMIFQYLMLREGYLNEGSFGNSILDQSLKLIWLYIWTVIS